LILSNTVRDFYKNVVGEVVAFVFNPDATTPAVQEMMFDRDVDANGDIKIGTFGDVCLNKLGDVQLNKNVTICAKLNRHFSMVLVENPDKEIMIRELKLESILDSYINIRIFSSDVTGQSGYVRIILEA